MQRELEAMSSRIDAESVARVDAVASIGRELREAGTSFELRVNRVDEAAAKNQRELRRQLLERTQSLSESIRKSREELLAAFEAEQDRDEGAPEEAERVSAH